MSDSFKFKHAFSIIRCQPFHIGHDRIVKSMLESAKNVTVVINSIQETGTAPNPLHYSIRKKMIMNVYRHKPEYPRLRIMGIADSYDLGFAKHALNAIAQTLPNLPEPDAFFAGSEKDALPFKGDIPHIIILDRAGQDFPFLSGNMVRDMIEFHDERWKQYVHPENYQLVEEYFYQKKLMTS